jgi:hypothetical protein
MKRAFLAATFLLSGVVAFAQTPGTQPMIDALRAQGFTDIEIGRPQGGKLTVEAHRQGVERTLVYDVQTGRLLSDQAHAVGSSDRAGAAHDTGEDHTSGSSASHDNDESHSGSSSSSHDSNDDHSGSSSSHDSSDSHSGSSSDHDSGDGHGDD